MGVLVTGGAGFIGSHMVLELLDAGEDVVVLDNLSTGFRWAVPGGGAFVEGDVGDQDLVRRLLSGQRIDAIIHFAGSVVVPELVADPLGYYLNNTCKSRSLIASAVEAKIPHFIFSSTAAVYGMPKENPVAETALPEPMSPYGSSKLMTEMMLRDTAQAHRPPLCGLALFQCRRRRPARPERTIDARAHPSDQGRLRSGAGRAALSRRVRHRLSHAGRHLRPRLYPRDRSRPGPSRRAALSPRRRRERGAELRLWQRLLGARSDQAVKRDRQADFPVRIGPRRPGDPAALVAGPSASARCSAGSRGSTISTPSSAMRLPGKSG